MTKEKIKTNVKLSISVKGRTESISEKVNEVLNAFDKFPEMEIENIDVGVGVSRIREW